MSAGIEDHVFNYWFAQVQYLEDAWDWMFEFNSHLLRPKHEWFQVCSCKQAKKLRKKLKYAGVV